MFCEGEIIYFDPFYFKNGNPAKEKYCLIIKVFGTQYITASLPTRKDSIPVMHEEKPGCVELKEINLNCFVIAANNVVTTDGKSFLFKTHLYGHELLDEIKHADRFFYSPGGTTTNLNFNEVGLTGIFPVLEVMKT